MLKFKNIQVYLHYKKTQTFGYLDLTFNSGYIWAMWDTVCTSSMPAALYQLKFSFCIWHLVSMSPSFLHTRSFRKTGQDYCRCMMVLNVTVTTGWLCPRGEFPRVRQFSLNPFFILRINTVPHWFRLTIVFFLLSTCVLLLFWQCFNLLQEFVVESWSWHTLLMFELPEPASFIY